MQTSFIYEIAPLDWIGVGLTAFLLLMGLVRGLWWQVIRFTSVVLAAIIARLFAPEGSAWLSEVWPDLPARISQGAAWVGLFALTLTAATLLGQLGQRLIDAMKLGFANRLAGGVIGAATGFSIHMALLLALSLLGTQNFVSRHVAGTYSENVYQAVGDRWQVVLGAETANELKEFFIGAAGRSPGESETELEGWTEDPEGFESEPREAGAPQVR